ncbi:MAG: HEAT repeat domain-containing protein, partial [Longimicrobiales bacterium]|nr:HEAT repeat domain-containing protein [Longimicrobiales bacterium]
MTSRARLAPLLAVALLAGACQPPDAGRPDFEALAYLRIVAAEDARPAGGPGLETLLRGTASPSPTLRAVAVRALGRLENPDRIESIAPLLDDEEPTVRRSAADALAQAVHRGPGTPALALLLDAVGREQDPSVLGALARSLGRLRLEVDERTGVARALVALSRGPEGDAPPYQMEGVALGMASFVQRLRGAPRPAFLQARLRELTRYGVRAPAGDVGAVRVRELAMAAYGSEGLTAEELGAFLSDPAAEVRWAAAVRLASIPDPFRSSLSSLALDDPSPRVRLEALRGGLGVAPLTAEACARL